MLEDPDSIESKELEALGERFLLALEAKRKGDLDTAAELLRDVLKREPRLAEPRIELAQILLDAGQLDEAEEQAREAVRHLDDGGVWVDELPEQVVRSLVWDVLGEALRMRADSDEVVFGTPERFEPLMKEANECFLKAVAFDPSNEHAAFRAGVDAVPAGAKKRPSKVGRVERARKRRNEREDA